MAYRPNITNNIILYLLFLGCDKHVFLTAWKQQRIGLFEKQGELLYLGKEVTDSR